MAGVVHAAMAVEVAERETDVHRKIRRERLNIIDDDGDADDEQFYSNAEGEVTEQEEDMLMARRLTEEEFERFKEGRCFICWAKGHVASVCPTKKKKISDYRP
eukprot:jgi/Tetstr1/426968/TSEL_017181.t1